MEKYRKIQGHFTMGFVTNEISPKGLSKFLFIVSTLHFLGHHLQELIKLNGSIAILVHFVYHVSQFRLCRHTRSRLFLY
jgi:hypothetical protein